MDDHEKEMWRQVNLRIKELQKETGIRWVTAQELGKPAYRVYEEEPLPPLPLKTWKDWF